jgi:hypothetical protein
MKCDACQKEFTPKKHNQRFCCNACKQKWHRQQRAQISRNVTAVTADFANRLLPYRAVTIREDFEAVKQRILSAGRVASNRGFICNRGDFERVFMDYRDGFGVFKQ